MISLVARERSQRRKSKRLRESPEVRVECLREKTCMLIISSFKGPCSFRAVSRMLPVDSSEAMLQSDPQQRISAGAGERGP